MSLHKWYKTQEGNPVSLWCIHPKTTMQYPVKGDIFIRVNNRPKREAATWTRKGKYPKSRSNHPKNLVEITQDEWEGLTKLLN